MEIPGKNIFIDQLEEMFDSISNQSDWNMNGDMLWGYFFTHHEPSKLEQAKPKLTEKGFTFVDIYLSDKEDEPQPDMYWLHVEKVESHTPQTLDKRNDELYVFAYEFGLDSYDGMDIGPVNQ